MNPDEVIIKEIKNILQEDLNKLHEIVNQNLDSKRLEEAFFLSLRDPDVFVQVVLTHDLKA